MEREPGPGLRRPGFYSWLHHWPAWCPWANCFPALFLGFPISKMGVTKLTCFVKNFEIQ